MKITSKLTKSGAWAMACAVALQISLTGLASCSSLDDDDHYANSMTVISNLELKIVNENSEDYIKSRSDLSEMNSLFTQQGIYSELKEKGQLSTILVVANDNYSAPTGNADNVKFVTRSHVSDISMSPSNLKDGGRIMMWHDKYVNVGIDSLGQQGNIVEHIQFNNASVKEVIKTNSGYVYVISDMISTPTSLYDYITSLGEDYSILRDMVLSSGGKEFDKANSKATGVNDEGNTTYDSVFIYKNTYFENKGFDMNSESLSATMLLFSNDVINAAIADAHNRMKNWGMESDGKVMRKTLDYETSKTGQKTLRGWRDYATVNEFDAILKQWILDVSFFNTKYGIDRLTSSETSDLKSLFGKQWRVNAQEVYADRSTELSNAVVHEVKKLHFPNNLLIYRLKECFYYYENCTDEQKAEYFQMSNAAFKTVKVAVAAWTPLAGVWPEHENRALLLQPGEDGDNSAAYSLDATLLKISTNSDGAIEASELLIPPGTYRLAMGFAQNLNMTFKITVNVEGQDIVTSDPITVGSATTYHYDRGGGGYYCEGYDAASLTHKKKANYDTDGGLIMNTVTIPDVKGNDKPVKVVLKMACTSWNGKSEATFYHWCLRPTVDNY